MQCSKSLSLFPQPPAALSGRTSNSPAPTMANDTQALTASGAACVVLLCRAATSVNFARSGQCPSATGAKRISEPFPAELGSVKPAIGSPVCNRRSNAQSTVVPISQQCPVQAGQLLSAMMDEGQLSRQLGKKRTDRTRPQSGHRPHGQLRATSLPLSAANVYPKLAIRLPAR